MVTHFDATLGMGGWLDLTQQGLSPCKTYKTSWRVFSLQFLVNEKYKIKEMQDEKQVARCKIKR